jgi:hypothetical protein
MNVLLDKNSLADEMRRRGSERGVSVKKNNARVVGTVGTLNEANLLNSPDMLPT